MDKELWIFIGLKCIGIHVYLFLTTLWCGNEVWQYHQNTDAQDHVYLIGFILSSGTMFVL